MISIDFFFKCPICDKKILFRVPAYTETEIDKWSDAKIVHEFPIDKEWYEAKARYQHSLIHPVLMEYDTR